MSCLTEIDYAVYVDRVAKVANELILLLTRPAACLIDIPVPTNSYKNICIKRQTFKSEAANEDLKTNTDFLNFQIGPKFFAHHVHCSVRIWYIKLSSSDRSHNANEPTDRGIKYVMKAVF